MKQYAFKYPRLSSLALGVVVASSFCLGSARAEDDEGKESEKTHQEQTPSKVDQVIEGLVIKVKAGKNEIYVRSAGGQREEIYLDKGVQITQGTKVLKIEDLKKDMKVRVTGRTAQGFGCKRRLQFSGHEKL
jgi:hypothetical protein